jgi:hypothetical protein
MIDSAEESGGLYYFDFGSTSQLPYEIIGSCFKSFSVLNNNDDNIMLWHFRSSHPSFPYLKHHRSHFAIQSYRTSKPFSIIHSDV